MNDKLESSQERQARERENLMLKIENQLLKAGRQLSPPKDEDE